MPCNIAMFGEAEKGQYHVPYQCHSLSQLVELFGNPPEESQGLDFAVQALLYNRDVFFVRVREEGFSKEDYLTGLKHFEDRSRIKHLEAICMPGVGDCEILDASQTICDCYRTILITTEKDLYDYLTSKNLS